MGKRDEGKVPKRIKKHRATPEKLKSPNKTKNIEDELDVDENTSNVLDDLPFMPTTQSIVNDDVDIEGNEEMASDREESTDTLEAAQHKMAGGSGNKKSNNKTNACAASSTANTSITNAKKSKKRRDSGTSSDEERWLSAIETGKLEDVDDELKKIKDPKLMTARQRAMYERGQDKDPNFPISEMLMSLPSGYREKEKPQTAEDIQKAALKIQRRKQQADEKREKDKKKTMDRLLRKQDSKQKSASRGRLVRQIEPMIRYINTIEGATIEIPADHMFPLKPQVARPPPPKQICGIEGCGKPKAYKCSKTNIPLCSLACYRRNVQNVRQIMC